MSNVSKSGFSAAIGILLLCFIVLFLNYVFLFLPTLALKNSQIARNALIFTITEWKTNLAILASTALLTAFTVLFMPYSIVLLVFLTIALQQYIVCAAINEPLQRRIIGAAETSKHGLPASGHDS